jgi:Na+-transporting NADH:ubiquinone oxidoreductase subunit NqrC
VQELDIPGLERRAFRAVVADSTIAYCFEIGGKGLWGTMQALVSTSTDFRTILDLALVSQQETPDWARALRRTGFWHNSQPPLCNKP